jgi:hypothetical protein
VWLFFQLGHRFGCHVRDGGRKLVQGRSVENCVQNVFSKVRCRLTKTKLQQ